MKKVVILVAIALLLITGCSVKKVKELSDNELFANEFEIVEENPFVYAKYDDIIKITKGTGIIFFANSDYEGCKTSAKYLNEVSKKAKVSTIYFYNIKKIEDKNSKKYKKLIEYFKDCLNENDNKYKFDLPMIVSIKDGKIINYSNYLSNEKELSEENLNKKQIKKIKKKYEEVINYEEYTK